MAQLAHPIATTLVHFSRHTVQMVFAHACSANLLNHMVRFIHTSDWQLGMTRRFLSPEAQSRFTDARIQAIRTIGDRALESGATFVVVAGDVFESHLVDRQLVLRALQAMKEAQVRFYLLPGNHDPLAPGAVYLSPLFAANCPPNVHILDGAFVEPEPGVTLVSAPWRSKKMNADPIAAACAEASTVPGQKIVVGHGGSEIFAPDSERPELIRFAAAEAAVETGAASYIALGDRHSRTALGRSGRIWYSGAPEPTDFDEDDPGLALLVELDGDVVNVEPLKIGTWRFAWHRPSVNDSADVARLRTWLEGMPAKDRTVLKLGFEGTVSLTVLAELDALIEEVQPMFAAIERRDRDSDLAVLPSEMDFKELGLSGFAAAAAEELGRAAIEPGGHASEARDALGLLLRLAKGAA